MLADPEPGLCSLLIGNTGELNRTILYLDLVYVKISLAVKEG